jgi:hypothetical protein
MEVHGQQNVLMERESMDTEALVGCVNNAGQVFFDTQLM